jgi:hypothetical protein
MGAHGVGRITGVRKQQGNPLRDKGSKMGEGKREPRDEAAWERYMEAERLELEHRRSGHLARLLGEPLPDETPEELARMAFEDQRRAEEGLVELRRGEEVWYKHIDLLAPEDRPARIEAEGARIEWITERQRRGGHISP